MAAITLKRPLSIAAILVVVTIALHAAPLGALDFYADDHVLDMLHVAGFATLTLMALFQLRKGLPVAFRSGAWPYALTAFVMMAVAVVAEGSQALTSRDAGFYDLLRDCSGIAGALLFGAGLRATSLRRGMYFCGAAASIVAGLAQPVAGLTVKLMVLQRLPVIADFEHDSQLSLFRPLGAILDTVPAPPGFSQGRVMRVRARTARRFVGVSIDEPVGNWTGFEVLSFRIATNGGEASELFLRIHDDDFKGDPRDRFVRRIPITPEPTTVRISLDDVRNSPATRQMDLSDIERVRLSIPSSSFVDFYFDDLRFE